MVKKQKIELHNEEVREIMKEIPGRLLRWGLAIIFMIFLSIIIGSYFFQFKEIVTAPLVITTSNPPAPVICKSSGRIAHWFVKDGGHVNKGDPIAVIKNLAIFEDILLLEDFIEFKASEGYANEIGQWSIPDISNLGELQESYNKIHQTRGNYLQYLNDNSLPKRIELLKQQMKKQKQHYQLSLRQQEMMEEELKISQKTFKRNQSLLNKGGISENQIEEARARLIQAERAYTHFLASLKSAEISMLSQKRSLMDLEEQYRNDISLFNQDITNQIQTLKKQLELWKVNYLLESPINGELTLTKYWSENHVVLAGDRLATIVPTDSSNIICRAVIASSGIGKVEEGQKVNIKLAGYPYMEHGMLTGIISSISLIPEEEGYIAEITMREGMLSSYSEQLKLVQEMDGLAEIITGEMRLIYRFISPLKMLLDKR